MLYPININETIETVKKLDGLKNGIINELAVAYPKFFCSYYFLNWLEKSLQDSDNLFKEKQDYSNILKFFDELKKMYRRRIYVIISTLILYFILGFLFIKFYNKSLNTLSVIAIAITLFLYSMTKEYFTFFFSKKQKEAILLKIINAGFTIIETEKRKRFINISEQIKQKALLN